MAANHDPSSPEQVERFKAWYLDDWTEVNGPIRKLLEEYSKVPSAEVVEHVNTIVSIQREIIWGLLSYKNPQPTLLV